MEKLAHAYKTYSGPQQKRGERLIKLADIKPGQLILDLGCGTGELSVVLAGKVLPNGKVIAVDPDVERLRIAKETSRNTQNLNFYLGDCCNLPPNQKYDCIFANYVLNWIPDEDLAQGMKYLYNALKPGGNFVFLVPHVVVPSPLGEILETLSAQKLKTFWENVILRDEKKLVDLAQNAGFKVASFKEEILEYFYSSEEELLRWMVSSHPGLFRLQDVDAEKFKKIQFKKNSEGEISVRPKLYLVKLAK